MCPKYRRLLPQISNLFGIKATIRIWRNYIWTFLCMINALFCIEKLLMSTKHIWGHKLITIIQNTIFIVAIYSYICLIWVLGERFWLFLELEGFSYCIKIYDWLIFGRFHVMTLTNIIWMSTIPSIFTSIPVRWFTICTYVTLWVGIVFIFA